MTKLRITIGALLILLATSVTVAACTTELGEVPAADAQTVAQTVPVTTTAAPTTTTTESPTTTTTEAPTTTEPPTTVKPKPVPTTTAKPRPVTTNPPAQVATNGDSFLNCVMMRESGGNPGAVNSSSGAGGLFQFLPSTWHAMGFDSRYGVARAEYASYSQQWEAAEITLAQVGRSPWAGPGC